MVSGNVNSLASSNNLVIGEGNIIKTRNPSNGNSIIGDNRGTTISEFKSNINDQREIERQRELELQR